MRTFLLDFVKKEYYNGIIAYLLKKEKTFLGGADLFFLNCQRLTLSVDFAAGEITSLCLDGKERMARRQPLFTIRLRDRAGETILLNTYDARQCRILDDGAEYSDFDCREETRALTVRVFLTQRADEAEWRILVRVGTDALAVEWVDFLQITLPHLIGSAQGRDGGRLLYPYNEGVLVDGASAKSVLSPNTPPWVRIRCSRT